MNVTVETGLERMKVIICRQIVGRGKVLDFQEVTGANELVNALSHLIAKRVECVKIVNFAQMNL